MIDISELSDVVKELVEGYRHIERIETPTPARHRKLTHVHVTRHRSLLRQLAAAVVPGAAYAEDSTGARSTPGSCPPARLDAIDRLLAIEAGTMAWCYRTGIRLRSSTADNLRALVGAATRLDDADARLLLSEVRAWRTWARTVTGWESPPWRPHAPCPSCERPDSLRVRLDRRSACCVECGAAWDATIIDGLARYIASVTQAA